MKELLKKRADWFEKKTIDLGFDLFTNSYEVVPEEVLLEVMSYGLPTRARHWGYGQSYEYQKHQGEMGNSKVYELIINCDPAISFILESNSDIANTLVLAHVQGHNYFFKHNYLFKGTDRKMVYHAAERAQRIDEYIHQHGIEKVERMMDIAFALEKNINWNKGIHRAMYPGKTKVLRKNQINEFDDLYNPNKPGYVEEVLNGNFPPYKEYDLLWFLANYADIEPWQKDIFEIIREESFYFYPQYQTKIMNEGLASQIHAEMGLLATESGLLNHAEHMDYMALHSSVVQPGSSKLNLNPYYLGFEILNEIRRDARYNDKDEWEAVRNVINNEDDISFLRNHLTQELSNKLGMFTYKTIYDKNKDEYLEIESTDVKDIIEAQISQLYNYHAPLIYIEKADHNGLELVHESTNIGTLDPKHMEKVGEYLYEIWGGECVNIQTVDNDGEELNYTYDGEVGADKNGKRFTKK